MKLSVQGTRVERWGRSLESTMELNQPKARAGLEAFFSPLSPSEEGVDVMAPFVLQRQKMKWCRERVVELDLRHQVEIDKLTKLLAQRKDRTSAVGRRLVDMRRVCGGLLRGEEFVEVGLDGTVSQDPVTVLNQGKKVQLAFAQPGLELESPAWVQAKIELSWMLSGLAEDVAALDAILDKIAIQRRVVEDLAAEKLEAVDVFDENHQLIGRSTEACFRMAGMKQAADRVRQASRRSVRSVGDEEPVPEADPSPEADPNPEAEVLQASETGAVTSVTGTSVTGEVPEQPLAETSTE